MRGFLVGTAVTAVAFFILVKLFPTMFGYDGELVGLVVIAVIFGIVNGMIGPIVKTAGLAGHADDHWSDRVRDQWRTAAADRVHRRPSGFSLTVGDFPPDLLTADTLIAAVVGAVILSVISYGHPAFVDPD